MRKEEQKGSAAKPTPARGKAPDTDVGHPAATERKAGEPAAERSTPVDIHAYIGTRLREVYDDVASQPVPDRFLDLMRQLDSK